MGRKKSSVVATVFLLALTSILLNCSLAVGEPAKSTTFAAKSELTAIAKPEMECYEGNHRVQCPPPNYGGEQPPYDGGEEPPYYGGEQPPYNGYGGQLPPPNDLLNCAAEIVYAGVCAGDVSTSKKRYGYVWVSPRCCRVFGETRDCLDQIFDSNFIFESVLNTCGLEN